LRWARLVRNEGNEKRTLLPLPPLLRFLLHLLPPEIIVTNRETRGFFVVWEDQIRWYFQEEKEQQEPH